MSGFVSKQDLLNENEKLKDKVSTLSEKQSDALPDVGGTVIINNPHKKLMTLRFTCVCCAEVEITALTYSQQLCAFCHRPMTRLKTWTS